MKKSLIVFAFLLTMFACKEKDNKDILNKYGIFSKIDTLQDGTLSLNNFKGYNENNEGFEILLYSNKKLRNSRRWKNNKLIGTSMEFSQNGALKRITNYVNGEVFGANYVLDTITQAIKEYKEYWLIDGKSYFNQYIYFKSKDKIDYNVSFFYRFKMVKISEKKMKMIFETYEPEATDMRIILGKFDINNHIVQTERFGVWSKNKNFCAYEQEYTDTLTGFIDHYRETTPEEKKKYNNVSNSSQYIYFKIPIN